MHGTRIGMRAEVSTISSWYVYQFCTNNDFDCTEEGAYCLQNWYENRRATDQSEAALSRSSAGLRASAARDWVGSEHLEAGESRLQGITLPDIFERLR